MMRGLLSEFGIDIPYELERALIMAREITEGRLPEVPEEAGKILSTLSQQALDLHLRVRQIKRDSRLATRQRHRQGPHYHSRRRSRRRRSAGGLGHRPAAVPLRPWIRRLARSDAAAKLKRRKDRLGRSIKMGDK